MKSVQIRTFFWSVFCHIRTEYGEIRSIQYPSVFSPNAGKNGQEKTPYSDTFHTVFKKRDSKKFQRTAFLQNTSERLPLEKPVKHLSFLHGLLCNSHNTSHKFWDQSLSCHVNIVCKYLRQFLDTSFGVAILPICCNID